MNQEEKKISRTEKIEIYDTHWICDYFEDGSPRKCRSDTSYKRRDSGIYPGRQFIRPNGLYF